MLDPRMLRPWLLGTLALVGPAASARAGLVVTVLNSTASAGGTGDFDGVLSNNDATGGPCFAVSGFSVDLQVAANSGGLFRSAGAGTASPYLFGTDQSPPLSSNTFPTTRFVGSDLDLASPYFVILFPGNTYGLEHVTYSVAAGTSTGPVAVSIVGLSGSAPTTQVDDISGTSIPIAIQGATITVSAAVPEPSSALLAALGMIGAAGWTASRRRPS